MMWILIAGFVIIPCIVIGIFCAFNWHDLKK